MVFLSYSSLNIKEATYIYTLLEKSGIDVWFAPKSIEEGADYGESIINAIENSDALILLLSKHSNASDHVLTEVDTAYKNKKPIFPLRLDNIQPTKKLEYRISLKQWVDLFEDFNTNISKFIQSIQKKLNSENPLSHQISKKEDINEVLVKQAYSLVTSPNDIERYLSEAILIDKQYYKEELSGVLETCMEWYEANNEIYSFIIDSNDKVVAYFNAMLIDEDLFQIIKEGKFLDNEISSNDIVQPFIPGVYKLYFCSVAIDQQHNHHKMEIFSLLYRGFFNKLLQWAEQDFYIEEIIADAVTQDGKNIAQSFGLSKLGVTSHTSTLYYAKMLPPNFKGTKEAQALFKKYKEYYENFMI